MAIYICDLEDLEDILDTLVFDEEPTIFSENYAVELVETILYLIEEYMEENSTLISEPNFREILLEDMKELFYVQMEDQIIESDFVEFDLDELLEEACNIYIISFYPETSNDLNFTNSNNNETNIKDNSVCVCDCDSNCYSKHNSTCEAIDESNSESIDNKINEIIIKINKLREIPQPVQRTPEWYQFRWNLITASNAYKAFETQSSINQLIYEKCQPLKTFDENGCKDDEEVKLINTNSALHWGQKYEPLSVMLYEFIYKSKVEDFGCIQHSTYKFLGASPDGIIIESSTGRFGRMLEIKNPVSREITGIPKKEYWIQMQLQMEVCDLDECDFLETKFSEYPDYISYLNDTQIDNNLNYPTKGIIIYFTTKEGKPFYVYKPLQIESKDEIEKWEDETLEKYQSPLFNYTFLKFIYWKLEKLSCVLVVRNKLWFKNNISQLENVWQIIEKERISGYEHRAPIKKAKKDSQTIKANENKPETCFLKVVKVD